MGPRIREDNGRGEGGLPLYEDDEWEGEAVRDSPAALGLTLGKGVGDGSPHTRGQREGGGRSSITTRFLGGALE